MKQSIEEQILEKTINHLTHHTTAQYIDEDWGQLSDYGQNPPVKWFCILIDISAANYSDIGRDRKECPANRQQGTGIFTFTIADLKLTNSSAKAPALQKEKSRSIHAYKEMVHEALQGFAPTETTGGFVRTGMRKIKRDDGIQQYQITYTLGLNNV
ncbi:hypothetical protein FNO01nite_30340 [Flavobacterium noncentrifugens]|uniref:Gp37 protein n=1 Tax=Flavobacterium noncentrifugens TaxID=1128970 RepID=A0A1G9BUE3_9FLAO|nr:hypothetical protein [Flavobacterium noncentrifugens]GEP52362.1 hypothetical protein FNO01nite_30340 [Flavobacterium noncentrifugens]SDK42774.1 hypothetical protein SAMN04487935_3347 [Flavobacterium noncentrifugens]